MSNSTTENVVNNDCIQVSIVIKALNEEKNIARCLESCLSVLENMNGEVILADSISSDQTVEIAKKYPVKIVQLKNIEDRGCGIGPQLGYQYSRGEFVYILDGDMEFIPGFLEQAIHRMQENTQLAGVAGIITERGSGNYDFEIRKNSFDSWRQAGLHPWLDMGGLYRRSAIESVGYFSNKNLNAFEEQELGIRLTDKNWILERIDVPSVIHYGHTVNTFELTKKRWRSGYLDGSGELVRNAMGHSYFLSVVKSRLSYIVMAGFFLFMMLSVLLIPWNPGPFLLVVFLLLCLTVAMTIRKKSLHMAVLGLSLWPIKVIAFLRGLLRKPKSPTGEIESIELASGD